MGAGNPIFLWGQMVFLLTITTKIFLYCPQTPQGASSLDGKTTRLKLKILRENFVIHRGYIRLEKLISAFPRT